MSQDPKTRASLILRLQNADDAAAWNDFAEIYQPLIYSLARRRGLQEADAFDLTQEVMTRVAKSISQWDPDPKRGSFRGWLATITRNMVVQFFRQNKRLPTSGNRTEIQDLLNNQPDDSLESEAFDMEHDRQVFAWAANQVKTQFAPNTWTAFWDTAVNGLSVADVAQNLGISHGAVYIARSRVMDRLKRTVQKSQFDSMIGKVPQ
jgi:RNA polymerase sigma-70 factor (ECF subfamily)